MSRLSLFLIAIALTLQAQIDPEIWKTDVSKRSIELRELRVGGPPKDGIPPLDHPKFVSVKDAARWLNLKEPVVVFEHEGEVRAYPFQILMWHELVNDRIGDLPFLVSYCPLCNSTVVYDRLVNGRVLEFGTSGMLRESDLVMYDRETESLWQQLNGEALVGAMTGTKLKILPSQSVSFESLAQTFPGAAVLSRETGYKRPYGETPYVDYEFSNRFLVPVSPTRRRLPPKERIAVVSFEGKTKAYPFSLLRYKGVIEDRIGEKRYVVFYEEGTLTAVDKQRIVDSKGVGSAGVFAPWLEGKRLRFRRQDGKIVDRQTGSVWNVLGVAVDGPLKGKRLKPVPHGVFFAFAWLVFNPDTEIAGAVNADGTPRN